MGKTDYIEEPTITIPVFRYEHLLQSHIRLNILSAKRLDEINNMSYVIVQTEDLIMGIANDVLKRVNELKKENDNE